MASKLSRNSPCPCGSGRKYKQCCMGKVETTEWYQPKVSHPVEYYRSIEFVETLHETDVAIYESFVISDRELTDREVREAVNGLIRDLRTSGFKPAVRTRAITVTPDGYSSLVAWNIRENWTAAFESGPPHSDEDLAGCLRSTLRSIETWSTPSADSQGYLYYLSGFLKSTGVNVRKADDVTGETVEDTSRPEDPLLELADAWLDAPGPSSWSVFCEEVDRLLNAQRPSAVVNVCQYLIGRTNENRVIELLKPLLSRAYPRLG